MDLWPRRRLPALIATFILLAAATAGCGRGPRTSAGRHPGPSTLAPDTGARATSDATAADSARADSIRAAATLRYGTFPITGEKTLLDLERRLGPDSLAVVLKLNRVDLAHARQGDTLVVPSDFHFERLSPFPDTLPLASALPRLLLVSARVQAFGAYDAGHLTRWGPTSTGRRTKPTLPGLYHANWRQRRRASTFNDEWILEWYVNLGNFDGISLHQYDLPGRPASHACVRLLADDAEWLYHWVDTWRLVPGDRRRIAAQGTPVLVMDEYAFGQRRPWKWLPDDPGFATLAPDSIEAALRRWGVVADSLARDTGAAARR
jgi:hypothetical protein